ncbi:unnamed protein product [Trichogramma brassicae]|uniref:Uncharacterized protein n=1 Tax=Trichogramma brassicae TaxID=86971 RepID=A0A6H5IYM0_9HYME|nr:unnamed protein product [Trichogramma brassicae]
MRDFDIDLTEIFFRVVEVIQKTVHINARDKLGRTALHYAVIDDYKLQVVRVMLNYGADPNFGDKEGLTPLHFICQRKYDDNLAEMFFETNKELEQQVQVDAQDKKGRTPLQLAVANLNSKMVDILLNNGAHLSSFVLSTESNFTVRLVQRQYERLLHYKLRMASAAMAVVDFLEERGYELDRSDALTIMKVFADYELLNKSADLEACLYSNKKFVRKAKKLEVNSSLSFYDLIQLPPEEVVKQSSYLEINWISPWMHWCKNNNATTAADLSFSGQQQQLLTQHRAYRGTLREVLRAIIRIECNEILCLLHRPATARSKVSGVPIHEKRGL